MLFVGTRKSTVWAVTNRNGGPMATEVKEFAPTAKLKNPNAVCWTKDGVLVVVESNRVLAFPAAEFFYEGGDVAVAEVVPQGKLIPPAEVSFNHSGRVCRVGADNLLYVALGQPFNVQPRAKLALYQKEGIGGIVRMKLDGTGREVYASGIRNSVGMDFNPKDGTLWFTDNQTDGMGDDIPLGEINRATKAGQFFGYPYIVAKTRITENGYDKDPIPAGAVDPQVTTTAHAADLGMAFYTGQAFPAQVPWRLLLRAARLVESHEGGGRAAAVHVAEGRRHRRPDRDLRRRLARRPDRHVPRSAGRRRDGEGRLAAGVGRLRRRDLSHLVRGAVSRLRSLRGAVAVVTIVAASLAHAGEPAIGKAKSAPCAACHGPMGIAVAPDAPNLAGQPEMYVVAQLKDYRDGKRKHEVMWLMAKRLSDADIDHLAAWYASLKVAVKE